MTWHSFQTTPWTLINLVRGSRRKNPEAENALYQAYYGPVYTFIRRTKRDRNTAEELTQSFITDVMMQRDFFGRARKPGRFRMYIQKSLHRYLQSDFRRRTARKNKLVTFKSNLEDEEAFVASVADCDPDTAFNRRYATKVLDDVLQRCKQHFVDGDMEAHWLAYEVRELRPALNPVKPVPYKELAPQLGFREPGDAAAAVQVVKMRARVLIRQLLAERAPGADQEEEYRNFLQALCHPRRTDT